MATRVKVPYQAGPDGEMRPYLWLRLTSDRGGEITTLGLLDTGADKTVLGTAYIDALGLRDVDLEPLQVETVHGSSSAWRALRPISGVLPDADELVVPLEVLFIDGVSIPLWGRDFMRVYSVAVDEPAKQFSLFAGVDET